MGKGLIPADMETWKVRRRAIVPGEAPPEGRRASSPCFHPALAMMQACMPVARVGRLGSRSSRAR